MKHLILAAAAFAALTAPAHAQTSPCPPAGYTRAQLETLKENEWALADDGARNTLALALAGCVGARDPRLRDGVAFEGLQHWLRARALTPETMLALTSTLEPKLNAQDRRGFTQPFAALILSELARADRIAPYLPAAQRARLLDSAIVYFVSVRDYRGFDAREGWRHGVAHGADLLLQLSLNPAFGKPELERVLPALETQVAPEGHFYIYGEPERLARPVIFMAQRGLISEEEWTRWFARFPAAGEDAFASQAGLAWRHNVMAFLQAIYLNARISENTDDDVLLPGVEAALQAMP